LTHAQHQGYFYLLLPLFQWNFFTWDAIVPLEAITGCQISIGQLT
jgi:hypothetical protein